MDQRGYKVHKGREKRRACARVICEHIGYEIILQLKKEVGFTGPKRDFLCVNSCSFRR